MIEPRRIGRYLSVDRFGHVEPDVAIDRIGTPWRPLVVLMRDALMSRQDVRSVCLRGSIPRGLAIENVSDADFIYFSENNFDAADVELEKTVAANFAMLRGVKLFRLDHAAFDKIHAPQRRPYFHMLVKTQCLLLAGDDIAGGIEPFRIGPDMVSHAFWLASEFSRLPRLLGQARDSRDSNVERSMRQWFSRRIMRSGLEITMGRSGRYTRDLYLCYEQFSEFYPAWSGEMYRVLINCLNGRESPLQYRELVTFLAGEASRRCAKALADPAPAVW